MRYRRVPEFVEAHRISSWVPHDELPVIKHRQLARQVGAFGEFMLESSADLNNMIFPAGSNFIFGSWICIADDRGLLQSRLMEV